MLTRSRVPLEPVERRALALAAACALHACAGSQAQRQPQLDAAFARIQVAEARIEHSRADVARPESACPLVGAARDQARVAQTELCRVAREIADPDALVRCEQAERSARSIALQAGRRCGS